MGYRKEFKVRFGDIDCAGIVYYPTLVHYTHLAMEDFFDEYLKYPYAHVLDHHRIGLPTVRFEMDFRKPLKYGDRVEHESRITKIGTTSVEWSHRFFLKNSAAPEVPGDLAAAARTVTVLMNLDSHEKVPLPDWLRKRLESTL